VSHLLEDNAAFGCSVLAVGWGPFWAWTCRSEAESQGWFIHKMAAVVSDGSSSQIREHCIAMVYLRLESSSSRLER